MINQYNIRNIFRFFDPWKTHMSTIAIIGVGAIGSTTAASLQIIKNKTSSTAPKLIFCTRRPIPTPLLITTPSGPVSVEGETLTFPPTDSSPVDWLFICTKVYHVVGTASWFLSLIGPQTRIAVLQNGVEHAERFAPYLSIEQQKNLLPVMVDVPAERRTDGSVMQWRWGIFAVPMGPLGSEFKALFDGSGADIQLSPDWITTIWKKLCINAPGAISAMTSLPNSVIELPGIEDVSLGVVQEAIAVGKAVGAKIEPGFVDEVMVRQRTQPGDGMNSLASDRVAEREMEVDARNGAIVRVGARFGVPTPLNSMVVAVLGAVQNSYLGLAR
jgi:2-dehydropantoate 2-reductase